MSRCRILEMYYILQVNMGVKRVSSNYWDSFGGKDDMGDGEWLNSRPVGGRATKLSIWTAPGNRTVMIRFIGKNIHNGRDL